MRREDGRFLARVVLMRDNSLRSAGPRHPMGLDGGPSRERRMMMVPRVSRIESGSGGRKTEESRIA